ncbi:hypothetical protein PRK78_006238 [Emydomyces testavorans]|uniref:Defect at low temperature protein 1 n=1 Tax=Emydomyces testavorans TaxID=2070801 RepID=A0AAF0DKZ9_9EURO|nr:hypothetical protein PRK78_006238 [Emydomyces testavorans]
MSSISQFFYTTFFTVLSVLLFILTLLTPGDLIYQSYTNHRLANIFAIAGVYIVTFLLVLLIYASRIFTNRSILAGIPKAWIPVEKPDVGKAVRRLVVEGLMRSATIAQQARPRDRSGDDNTLFDQSLAVPVDSPPPWGTVSHPGWTAPDCEDLPGQEFETVVKELPHLIEAKAVSLAPPDPRLRVLDSGRSPGFLSEHDGVEYVPDERVVKILQRPSWMCLRDYVNHLNGLGLISPSHLGDSFLDLYERSRFSARPLTEVQFRTMIGIFAEILRGMTVLDPEIILNAQMEDSFGETASFSGQSSLNTESLSSSISISRAGSGPYRYPSFSSSGKASFRLRDGFERRSLRSISRRSISAGFYDGIWIEELIATA